MLTPTIPKPLPEGKSPSGQADRSLIRHQRVRSCFALKTIEDKTDVYVGVRSMEEGDKVRHVHTGRVGIVTSETSTTRVPLITVQYHDNGATESLPVDLWRPYDVLTSVEPLKTIYSILEPIIAKSMRVKGYSRTNATSRAESWMCRQLDVRHLCGLQPDELRKAESIVKRAMKMRISKSRQRMNRFEKSLHRW